MARFMASSSYSELLVLPFSTMGASQIRDHIEATKIAQREKTESKMNKRRADRLEAEKVVIQGSYEKLQGKHTKLKRKCGRLEDRVRILEIPITQEGGGGEAVNMTDPTSSYITRSPREAPKVARLSPPTCAHQVPVPPQIYRRFFRSASFPATQLTLKASTPVQSSQTAVEVVVRAVHAAKRRKIKQSASIEPGSMAEIAEMIRLENVARNKRAMAQHSQRLNRGSGLRAVDLRFRNANGLPYLQFLFDKTIRGYRGNHE